MLQTGWSRQNATWTQAVSKMFEDETADPFDALARTVVERSQPDRTLEPLEGEFWQHAVRNPDTMAIFADTLREQHDRAKPIIEAAMQRDRTPPGITPAEMTTLVLVLLPGLTRFRRIYPDSVPDDLLARALRRLFGIESNPPSSRPPTPTQTPRRPGPKPGGRPFAYVPGPQLPEGRLGTALDFSLACLLAARFGVLASGRGLIASRRGGTPRRRATR